MRFHLRRCGNAEDLDKTAKDRVRLAPKPLPNTRPRSLTPPLPEVSTKDEHQQQQCPWIDIGSWTTSFFPGERAVVQHTADQSSSPLITMLPPEIRHRIWKDVLGGHWLHVVRAHNRLLAIKCAEEPVSSTMTAEHLCWHTYQTLGLWPNPDFWADYRSDCAARAANLLSLPLTCRLIHSETIDILYQDNVFDFNHLDTVIYLSQTTLQSRLSLIRRVCLFWYFKYPMYPFYPKTGPESPDPDWLIPHITMRRGIVSARSSAALAAYKTCGFI